MISPLPRPRAYTFVLSRCSARSAESSSGMIFCFVSPAPMLAVCAASSSAQSRRRYAHCILLPRRRRSYTQLLFQLPFYSNAARAANDYPQTSTEWRVEDVDRSIVLPSTRKRGGRTIINTFLFCSVCMDGFHFPPGCVRAHRLAGDSLFSGPRFGVWTTVHFFHSLIVLRRQSRRGQLC